MAGSTSIQARENLKSKIYEELRSLKLLVHVAYRRRVTLCAWGCLSCSGERQEGDCNVNDKEKECACNRDESVFCKRKSKPTLNWSHLLGAMNSCSTNSGLYKHIQAAQLLQRRRQVGLSPAMSNEDKKRCCVLWAMSYTLGSKKHYLDGNTYSM